MITIVDYGMGNINSVKKTVSGNGENVVISSNPMEILSADKLILPGVGHFQNAVENLKRLNLWDAINEAVLIKKKPILGICLGMQLMAKNSEEGETSGFGWFDAEIVRFQIKDRLKYKVPHIGWNQVYITKESKLMSDIPELSEFYFVHSYHLKCNNNTDILSETEYEYRFTSAVECENIFGVQFHPEKSHDAGNLLMKNFINI
jgi:imidazole glycerol-phosphate synthase subunit HisH